MTATARCVPRAQIATVNAVRLLISVSTCGLVAMTSAPHAEGRQVDPGQVYSACIGDMHPKDRKTNWRPSEFQTSHEPLDHKDNKSDWACSLGRAACCRQCGANGVTDRRADGTPTRRTHTTRSANVQRRQTNPNRRRIPPTNVRVVSTTHLVHNCERNICKHCGRRTIWKQHLCWRFCARVAPHDCDSTCVGSSRGKH